MKKNVFMFGAILICLIAYSNVGRNVSALGLDEAKEKKAIFQVIQIWRLGWPECSTFASL